MPLLRVRSVRLGGLVDLRLEARLHDVQGAGDNPGKTSGRCAGKELKRDADVAALLVAAGPGLELLPEHELQSREGQITEQGGSVAMEEGGRALCAHDGTGGIDGATVIVARFEIGIIITALELQASLEHLRGYINNGSGKIAKET